MRLNLSGRKSADCIFLRRQCLTGGNGIEETKFAILFLGPGTLPFLVRFFFFYCLQDVCYKVWGRGFISVSDRDIEI